MCFPDILHLPSTFLQLRGGVDKWLLEGISAGVGDVVVPPMGSVGVGIGAATDQVWSLTRFFSVDFLQSRISVDKCVLNKRTIKVCVNCF